MSDDGTLEKGQTMDKYFDNSMNRMGVYRSNVKAWQNHQSRILPFSTSRCQGSTAVFLTGVEPLKPLPLLGGVKRVFHVVDM